MSIRELTAREREIAALRGLLRELSRVLASAIAVVSELEKQTD